MSFTEGLLVGRLQIEKPCFKSNQRTNYGNELRATHEIRVFSFCFRAFFGAFTKNSGAYKLYRKQKMLFARLFLT